MGLTLSLGILSALFPLFASVPTGAAGWCPEGAAVLVVNTGARELRLCEAGRPQATYHVALGRHGVGKRSAGDGRTPLGTYPLGLPRPSARFHLFIPVGYPTQSQKERGFSGGDIGIHGPERRFAWLGPLTTWVDWTQGCIAVGTRTAIETIARWVTKTHAKSVWIE